MANAMPDARQEDGSYRRIEVMTNTTPPVPANDDAPAVTRRVRSTCRKTDRRQRRGYCLRNSRVRLPRTAQHSGR